MKLLSIILIISLIIITFFFINYKNKVSIEGLCDKYSLTYSKIQHIFKNSDLIQNSNDAVKEIKDSYNKYYSEDCIRNDTDI
jgi:hypothetical protein